MEEGRGSMTTPESRFELDDQVITETIGDEMILLDLNGERYLSVDRVGQQVWTLLGGGASVNGVVEALESTYHVDVSVLRSDVDSFIAKLLDLGLVHPLAA
jgi:hypothetical protein